MAHPVLRCYRAIVRQLRRQPGVLVSIFKAVRVVPDRKTRVDPAVRLCRSPAYK